MDSSTEIQSLKVKIKEWEKKFASDNGRKPTPADIKHSSRDIVEAYATYWKTKRCVDARPLLPSSYEDDVWSPSLNKSKTASSESKEHPNPVNSYCNKIRDKLFASFELDIAPRQSSPSNNLQIAQSEPATLGHTKQQHRSEGSALLSENKAPFHNGNIQADAIHLIQGRCSAKVGELQKSTSYTAATSPSKGSPIPKTVYYKKCLNKSWLARNSLVGDDDVFLTPSSTPQLASRLVSDHSSSALSEKAYMKCKVSGSSQWHTTSDGDTNEVFLKSPVPRTASCQSPGKSTSSCTTDGNSEFPAASKAGYSEPTLNTRPGPKPPCALNLQKPRKTRKARQLAQNAVKIGMEEQETTKQQESRLSAYEFVDDTPIMKDGTKKRRRVAEKVAEGEQPTAKRGKAKKYAVSEMSPTEDKPSSDVPYRAASRKLLKTSIERRMESGTLNENFVRINLKKKKFSRGHHKVNIRKLKFQEWKGRKYGLSSKSHSAAKSSPCFKCGELGHWARSCPGKASLLEHTAEQAEPEVLHLPTLEEAAAMACGVKSQDGSKELTQVFAQDSTDLAENKPPEEGTLVDVDDATHGHITSVEVGTLTVQPLLDVDCQGNIQETPTFVYDALHKMGFSTFRPGQEATIMRILSGLSTLLVSSTGSGKSLCYQLPAYLFARQRKCITLVISPLISLMEDQVVNLPPCLKAAFLHSAMPPGQKQQVLDRVKDRNIHFLLISPESLMQSKGMLETLPPVAFACIDEAHCLSEWSHNFRPSYLQLYKILTTKMKVRCILALTATATRSTCLSIAEHLSIKDTSAGVIGMPSVPDNLVLSVSEDEYRDEALIELLKGSRIGSCESIIVYCTRRDETERLASLIRTSLQSHERPPKEEGKKTTKGKKSNRSLLTWDVEAYHAGMTSFTRRSVQKKFMAGKLRVIVATVAFGMGINKADIRAIIHYNMPKSFESYVQEAGRAGRDGLTSHCHLFLEPEGRDQSELKRHIYADSTDRHVIRKLLKKIFAPLSSCNPSMETSETGKKYARMCEVAIPIDRTVEELDMKEENILTLLCFLEFHPRKVVQVFNKVYATCTIKCYGGPAQLRALATKNAPVAAAMALAREKGEQLEGSNSLSFEVVAISARMGWNSKLVKRDLKSLEWDNSALRTSGHARKTGVIVEFSDLSFHLSVAADLSEEDQDSLLNYLYERAKKQEEMDLRRLKQVNAAFESVACKGCTDCIDTVSLEKSNQLKQLIQQYFKDDLDLPESETVENTLTDQVKASLQHDIRGLVSTHRDHTFNGRAVARIFHGIASPCFPAQVWGRVRRYWRSYLDVDFNVIVSLANQELMSCR